MDYPKTDPSIGLVGGKFTDGDPSEGFPASLDPASWANLVTDELLNVVSSAGLVPSEIASNQVLASLLLMSPLVGAMSNGRMVVAAASTQATFTADQIILAKSLNGRVFLIPNFNQTLNLGVVGAGGMDAGAAPANGFVAIYAIYNPLNGSAALLATNTTAAVAPSIYGGPNMPAGYSASALVSVVQTNSGGQILPLFQRDRHICVSSISGVTLTSAITNSPISLPIPMNAKSVRINIVQATATGATNYSALFAPNTPVANGMVQANVFMTMSSADLLHVAMMAEVEIITPQTIFGTWVINGGTNPTLTVNIAAYSI